MTYVLLLLIQSVLRLHSSFPLLTLIHLESARCALEVAKCLISDNNGFLDDVVQKDLVVGRKDQGTILCDEILLEPQCGVKILTSQEFSATDTEEDYKEYIQGNWKARRA